MAVQTKHKPVDVLQHTLCFAILCIENYNIYKENGMGTAIIIVSALLMVWFFGCIVTYKIGSHVLVDGEGVKSAEFIMLLLYSCALLSYFFYKPVGRWILLGTLALWIIVQFFCHWYYTIFGVSEKKLQGYNKCFHNTVRLFPLSEKRLVPDLYHIVLHLLILLDITLIVLEVLLAPGDFSLRSK